MTLKKRYSFDNAIFDFPGKPFKPGETITRRLQSIVSRSMLSGRNLPVRPNFNLFSPKCYCNRNLYFFLPPTPRFLRRSSSLNIDLIHTRENFAFSRANFFTEPDLTRPEAKLPLRLSQLIRQKKENRLFFSSFSQIEPPKILDVQLEYFEPADKISDFAPLLPAVSMDSVISSALPDEIIQPTNFAGTFYFKVLPGNFVSSDLTLNNLKQGNLKNELILALPSRNHFCLSYQTPVFQESDSFISLQKPAKRTSIIETVPRPAVVLEFENRTEIGKNLILEVKTQTNCLFGADTPIEKTRFLGRMINNRRPDSDFTCSSKIKLKTPKLRFDFRCLPEERLNLECKFEKIFTGDAELQNFSRKSLSLARFSTSWHSPRPRLRLKLKKNPFVCSEPSMHLLPGQKIFPAKAFAKSLPTRQNFRCQKPIDRLSEWKYQTKYLPQTTDRTSFRFFRLPLFFITRKHARYCLGLLQKIKAPPLPLKPALIDLRRQHLAGSLCLARHYSNVFMTNPGFFSDTAMILGRPALFLMTVTNLNFTDISLPHHQRKVKSPNGYFRLPEYLSDLQSLNRQLQRLSFSIEPEHAFIELPGKRTRIRFVRRQLKLFKSTTVDSQLIEKFVATSSSCPEKYFQHNLTLEKKLQDISGLPKAIAPSMPLPLKPILPEKTPAIQQRNIIPPPEWQKAEAKFNCRLRLLPYPFGFPGFNQPKFSMKCIYNEIRAEILPSPATAIEARGYNYSLNRKTYSSKYSLKKPERWLFPNIGRAVFQLFPVLPHCAAMPVDHLLKPLPAPNAFAFSWQKEPERRLQFEDYYSHRNKVFHNSVFTESANFVSESWTEATLPTPRPRAKKIRRLLLKQSKSFCRRAQGEISKAFLSTVKDNNLTFKMNEPQIVSHWPFSERKTMAPPQAREILAFYFKFPANELTQKTNLKNFKALFRQFHFPYTPVSSEISVKNLPYFELDDTSNLVAFAPGEEIRVSQIRDNEDFKHGHSIKTTFSLISQHEFIFVHNFKREMKSAFNIRSNHRMQHLATDLKWQISSMPRQYLQLKDWKGHNKTVAKPKAEAKFSHDEFWNNSLDYVASSRLRNRFRKLNLDSPHWVILLKNFLDIGQIPEKWQVLSPFEKARLQQFKTIDPTGSSNQLFFYNPRKQSALQLSPPDIPLFFASVQKTLPKTEKLAIVVSASLSTITRAASGFSFAKRSLTSVNNPGFCQKLDSGVIMNQTERSEDCIEFNFDREIKFSDFKMQRMIVKGSTESKTSGKKLRPRRSSFRPHSIPDWVDMEMQHVDLSL